MAVAEMPGDADQVGVAMGVNFRQRFRLGHHFDNAAFNREAIAIAEAYGLRQVEQQAVSGRSIKPDAAAEAAIEIHQDLIAFLRCVPCASGKNLCAEHQKRKYRCAIGNILAGSQVSSTPSALTS